MSIKEWQRRIHELATDKAWWDGYERVSGIVQMLPDQILAKLALIHSEVSEALEDVRVGNMETTTQPNGKPVGFPTELADVVIRCFDLAEAMGIDLEAEIDRKNSFNRTRPVRHGNKRA
jgi:NTP pyrophosphatase (non-canonical NTP hydrolase)